MRKLWILAWIFMVSGMLHGEELIENGDFSKARNHWKIDARDEMTPDVPSLLRVNLNDRKWSKLEQDLKLSGDPTSALTVKIELQPSADFKPEEKSKEYSDVDFAMGGGYGWSALVFPKSDCLIIIENGGGWEYRPIKLKPGAPQTIQADFKKVLGKKSMITVAFPPGTGSVVVKSVSVDLVKPK